MQHLLLKINTAVDQAGGELLPEQSKKFWKLYRKIIKEGEIECPAPGRPEGENYNTYSFTLTLDPSTGSEQNVAVEMGDID